MKNSIFQLAVPFKEKLHVEISLLIIYFVFYLLWGMAMNSLGIVTHIARFQHWWQVGTCYLGYMVPISLLIRDRSVIDQYVYGVFAIGLLELAGYSLHTSIAYDHNILDQILGIRNFTLAMTLFFGVYFPLGNWIVGTIHRKITTH